MISNKEINDNDIKININTHHSNDKLHVESFNSRIEDHYDNYGGGFVLKRVPKKILFFCILLNILGTTLFSLIFYSISIKHLLSGLLFGIFSMFLLIPGIYYGVKIYVLGKTECIEKREEILRDIPISF